MRIVSALIVAGVTFGVSGCAHRIATPAALNLQFDALEIEGDAALAQRNDEELFAMGVDAYGKKKYERAAKCFDRLAETFPKSPRRLEAIFNAGSAFEERKNWELARERFAAIADPMQGQGIALDAALKLVEVDYNTNALSSAGDVLRTLRSRTDLPPSKRIEATVQLGVIELEVGDRDAAERHFQEALTQWQSAPDNASAGRDYAPAQAQFFLGEVARLRFEEQRLPDRVTTADALSVQIDSVAKALLTAEAAYLKAIRFGVVHWGTAAGQRIGAMYERLYQELSEAPPPRELAPEARGAYDAELHKRIAVLLTNAIEIYEATLAAAQRNGASSTFTEESSEGLQRMRAMQEHNDRALSVRSPP